MLIFPTVAENYSRLFFMSSVYFLIRPCFSGRLIRGVWRETKKSISNVFTILSISHFRWKLCTWSFDFFVINIQIKIEIVLTKIRFWTFQIITSSAFLVSKTFDISTIISMCKIRFFSNIKRQKYESDHEKHIKYPISEKVTFCNR